MLLQFFFVTLIMVSLERTQLKMTVEHLLQFFPIYRNLQDIEVGLICKLHNDAQLVMSEKDVLPSFSEFFPMKS